MENRANEALKIFFANNGYEIFANEWPWFFVMDENEDMHLVHAMIKEAFGPVRKIDLSRQDYEEKLIDLLGEPFVEQVKTNTLKRDFKILFDEIQLVVVSGDRALIRHHINCFNN